MRRPAQLLLDQAPNSSHPAAFWAERLVELFLIGDEDSLLHGKTSLRLAA